VPTFASEVEMVGTRSLSSGARSRDPLALPTLQSGGPACEIDKIDGNPLSGGKPCPQEPCPRKPEFRHRRACFLKNRGGIMSVLRETVAAVVGVYALLLACDACFGVGEARFDDDFYRASFYAPRPSEVRIAGSVTAAARVSDAFAQFTPGEAKPGKRYSLLTTIIR
jgi:hypothetical protein